MLRLGWRLTLRSGREALVRLIITACAVAVGVLVLLSVLAYFHAFQATTLRPSWESTEAAASTASPANETLWNYSENLYRGRFIEELDVAALGPGAPVIPGLSHLPAAGQYYASPALASLLSTVPRDQLGDRFPGRLAGTIGQPALSGPDELVIVIGRTQGDLAALPGTITVDRIATAPQTQGTTNLYRMAFGAAAIALIFPLLILVNTATRLAAARREERYAAMRLVGGTPRQVDVIASVDAIFGASLGSLLGVGLFAALRPALADVALSGARFFSRSVTPTALGYAAMLVGVPVAAAVGAQMSLHRVRISPLGVSRKVTPARPRAWRLLPLAVGIPLFLDAALKDPKNASARPVFGGLLLTMLGLVLAGPWLTMMGARLLGKVARRAPSLLAARRLADNPKGSFRTVSGLVLAVFVGSGIGVLAPAVHAAQSPATADSLTNVLRAPYGQLPAATASPLIASLAANPGVSVVPLYTDAVAASPKGPGGGGPGGGPQDYGPPPASYVECGRLRALPVLGQCPAGMSAVEVNVNDLLFTDNPLFVTKALPIVTAASPATAVDLTTLPVQALLIKTGSAATLERVRTQLTAFNASVVGAGRGSLSAWQMGSLEPETFGEMAQIRNNDVNNVEKVILAVLGLTLLVAGCSLAVTVGGSVVERRRQFTLLRLTGAPTGSLRSVVLLESVLPLVLVSLVAAGTGLGVTLPLIKALLPELHRTVYPNLAYYLALGGGLVASLLVIMATLPLLNRLTQPGNARFE